MVESCYMVVEEKDVNALSEMVNKCMVEGWSPIGGVVVATKVSSSIAGNYTVYCQALKRSPNRRAGRCAFPAFNLFVVKEIKC